MFLAETLNKLMNGEFSEKSVQLKAGRDVR